MPVYRTSSIWPVGDPQSTIVVVPTNAWLKKDYTLTMGAGNAKQAAKRYLDLPYLCGSMVHTVGQHETDPLFYTYGYRFIISPTNKQAGLGIFQVQHSWKGCVKLELIERSAQMLAKEAEIYPQRTYRLAFPGIGQGLQSLEVQPFLEPLPDNVVVCLK